MIGGFDLVPELGWVIIAQDDAHLVLAPVTEQRSRAMLVVGVGGLLAIGISALLAWRTSRPLRRLTEISRRAAMVT